MPKLKFVHLCLSSCLVVLLLFIAFYAGRFAVADFYLEQASTAYQQANVESVTQLQTILVDIDKALQWRANSAEALDLKAEVLYQYWWLSPDGQYYSDSSLLQQADHLHKQALKYRNDWSFTLARLAFIHANKPHLDEEFNTWFKRAYELGRYETKIAYSMMLLGFDYWDQFDAIQRQQTIEFARISIEQKANKLTHLKAVFMRHQQWHFICQTLPSTERKETLCLGA